MGKYLILVPKLNLIGGIANYYDAIRPFLPEDFVYFVRGSRGLRHKLLRLLVYGYDIIRFMVVLVINKPGVVVINTSMGQQSMQRDALFVLLAKRYFRRRVVVFFRGWDESFLLREHIPEWFNKSYMLADKTIVLASKFREQLQSKGYQNPIVVETTVVSKGLLDMVIEAGSDKDAFSVLFMSRIEENKGIFQVIRAAQILMSSNKKIQFDILGAGSSLQSAKELTNSMGLANVTFHGFVKGTEKARLLKKSDVFLFPSYHGEGMPNAVLEAMASGLPVITTRVGGIEDFFMHEKMGFFIDGSQDEIVKYVKILGNSPELCQQIGTVNRIYAEKNFLADAVAKRLQAHLRFDEPHNKQ